MLTEVTPSIAVRLASLKLTVKSVLSEIEAIEQELARAPQPPLLPAQAIQGAPISLCSSMPELGERSSRFGPTDTKATLSPATPPRPGRPTAPR